MRNWNFLKILNHKFYKKLFEIWKIFIFLSGFYAYVLK